MVLIVSQHQITLETLVGGKIQLTARTEENEFNFYGNVGVGGISTSAYVIRTAPLKYLDYT